MNTTVKNLLALFNCCHKKIHLRTEPESIVDKLGKLWCKHIPQSHYLPVHSNPFNIPVGNMKDSGTRCFIYTSRFDPDKPVLYHIEQTDAVFSGYLIQIDKKIERILFY